MCPQSVREGDCWSPGTACPPRLCVPPHPVGLLSSMGDFPRPSACRSPMFWLHSRLGTEVPRPALQQPVQCLESSLTSTPPSCLLLLAHLTARARKPLLTTGEGGTALREDGWQGQRTTGLEGGTPRKADQAGASPGRGS